MIINYKYYSHSSEPHNKYINAELNLKIKLNIYLNQYVNSACISLGLARSSDNCLLRRARAPQILLAQVSLNLMINFIYIFSYAF